MNTPENHPVTPILIALGAFKHALSAIEVAQAIARGLQRSGWPVEIHLMPLADGGNGTLDAFLVHGGTREKLRVMNPIGEPIEAAFGQIDHTAIVELALASGIERLHYPDPMHASTYGTGQLMQAALDRGARRVIVGLGGSASTDGGAGALMALGARLLDTHGNPIALGGAGLLDLGAIDLSGLDPRWQKVELILATDVDRPALGDQGAAYTFAPQKGATPTQVSDLERGIAHFLTELEAVTGRSVRDVPGSGAAGASAAGLLGAIGGRIESGIDLLLDHAGFDQVIDRVTYVITGEGRLDDQSLAGKTPIGVAHRARLHGVKTIAIVGALGADESALHAAGLWAVLPIVIAPITLAESIARSAELIERAAQRLGYLLGAK